MPSPAAPAFRASTSSTPGWPTRSSSSSGTRPPGAVEQAGLPPGVLNIIAADREVSEELVRNPGIDKISFTGSTAAGRRIARLRAEGGGRVTLELGGQARALAP